MTPPRGCRPSTGNTRLSLVITSNTRFSLVNRMRVPLVNAPAPHLLTKLNPERMYLLGDPRTNQNPAFLVMGILFYRWHNYQALFPKVNFSKRTF